MYSLIIKNALVIDGSGTSGEILDVAINNEKIVNVDKNISVDAKEIIDAKNKILCPGFIDLQNHSDSYWQIFDNPRLDSLIKQGFTSIFLGNCGASLAPLLNQDSILSIQKWHNLEGVNIDWQTFDEFLYSMSKQNFPINIGSFVGYGTLRRGIVGDQVRRLDESEISSFIKSLEDALDFGAFGLSAGLSYSHESIASELELFQISKVLKKHNALLSAHIRNESDEIIESVNEVIEIAEKSGVNAKISHLKLRGSENWHKYPELISIIENAYHNGINLNFDVYPYNSVWQPLYSYLPKWAVEGGRKILLKHLDEPVTKNKILMYLNSKNNIFSEMIVASTANKLSATGKKIGQIAKNLNCTSEQALLHIIQNGGSEILIFEQSLQEKNVIDLLLHPLSFVGTDGAGFSEKHTDSLVHPRCFGSAQKFLNICLENNVGIEEGIKKITSMPAKKIGLKGRGEIKIGNFADIVIFDIKKLKDKSTYLNPFQFSEGIENVIVNGQLVLRNSGFTNINSGKILRKTK